MLFQEIAPQELSPGCLIQGPSEASALEPLTTLVGAEIAERMLSKVGAAGLASMSAPNLANTCDVSLGLAERVVAARALTDVVTDTSHRIGTNSAALASHIPVWLARAETEFVIAFALGSQLDVKAMVLVAMGGASDAAVAPRDVFVPLIRLNASAFAMAHNHPGGNCTPSRADVIFTNALARVGEVLGVRLVDHLIVTATRVLSFCDIGLMPTEDELQALASQSVPSTDSPLRST